MGEPHELALLASGFLSVMDSFLKNWGWASAFQGVERGNEERKDLRNSPGETQDAGIL